MPSRWGSDGIYQDGKAQITCKTHSIHEHSLNQLEVVQARWHPNSPTDSHLIVLFSDNSLKMYDDGNLKHVWRVGPLPNHSKNFSYLKSFGDTAIDFEIAPAQVSNEYSPNNTFNLDNSTNADETSSSIHSFSRRSQAQEQKRVEWPIVILRGNGSIFILCAGFNTKKPRIQGPITMIPAQKDNYGDDSCSLLVIPTLPVTIVIAENSGILHHALLIENNNAADMSLLNETKTLLPNDWSLYVLENIELELGLQEDDKKSEHCPLFLRRDPLNDQRYFCYHDAGLHGITIGFVQQLQAFVEDESNNESGGLNMNVASRAEYILSTKAFNTSKINSVVGFGILQLPSGIFAVTSSGQVVSLSIVKSMLPLAPLDSLQPPCLDSSFRIADQKSNKTSFDQHIRTLLKSDVTQPILQLDKSKPPSSQQTFQLLMNSIQIMRDKQFSRHDTVRQEIMKRIKILALMKNQQKDEISHLFATKEQIQEKAYKLADNHEDIMERQQKLQKRIQSVSRLAMLRLPAISSNEKDFADTIKKYKMAVDKLAQDVRQVKAKNDTQRSALENWSRSNEDYIKTSLPPKQEESIKEFLSDMMRQITSLKSDVQKIDSVID